MSPVNYEIVTKKNVSILTLAGDICKDDKESLTESVPELLSAKSNAVIIYFKDVGNIETGVLRTLTLLQHEVRRKKKLSIVGLNSQLKNYLQEKGVIRAGEFLSLTLPA